MSLQQVTEYSSNLEAFDKHANRSIVPADVDNEEDDNDFCLTCCYRYPGKFVGESGSLHQLVE